MRACRPPACDGLRWSPHSMPVRSWNHTLTLSKPHHAEIRLLQADTFDLHGFQTLTGTIFIMMTQPGTPDAAETLRNT